MWAYGLIVAAALIYFALEPTHGLRAALTLVLLAGLAVAGMAGLGRLAGAEFPDARPGDTVARLRAWFAAVRARRMAGAPIRIGGAEEHRLAQLERLARLRQQGVLTDEELAAEKARVLTSP